MSGVMAAACCCGAVPGECPVHRPFRVSLRAQAARELLNSSFHLDAPCPGDPPTCNVLTNTCDCPKDGQCLAIFDPGSGTTCNAPGIQKHYVSTFDMDELVVTVPYLTTVTETPFNRSGCTWRAMVGGVLVDSGLGYMGTRNVDRNALTINYSRTFTSCAGCCTWSADGTGESQTLVVNYGYRCKYGTPPHYMSIQRAASGTYLDWTWEISGGIFIVRNVGGAIQESYDMNGKTLAQALAAINAFASVVAVGPVGPIAADSFPATFMYDRPAALIPVATDYAMVWLVPPGTTVEPYQDGHMSAYWEVASETTDPTPAITCLSRFYLKSGCDSPDSHDFTLGTSLAAESVFCKGIATKFADWENTYSPVAGFNQDTCQGWTTAFGSVNTFGRNLDNYPTGHWESNDCDFEWVEDAPCAAIDPLTSWIFTLGAYGDTPTDLSYDGQEMCSDTSALDPTNCYSHAAISGCDYCENGCGSGQTCSQTVYRAGWWVRKSFKVERL